MVPGQRNTIFPRIAGHKKRHERSTKQITIAADELGKGDDLVCV